MADLTLRPIDPIHVATDDTRNGRGYHDRPRREPSARRKPVEVPVDAASNRAVECHYDAAGAFETLIIRDRETGAVVGRYSLSQIQRLKAESHGESRLFERRG
ncbi:hypothetical protein AYO38_11625 [bacterium SCGC AG-212-C10]|nr:hypothetical protein AYO38_11625 [bacterium SCGC AG-212-C10]